MIELFLVTIFRIDSEIRIQDAISQEIDARVLKSFEVFDEAEKYLKDIKNSMLMINFPFAMIQKMKKEHLWQILDQKLYLLDEVYMKYERLDDLSILTLNTRKKLHDFDEIIELVM